MIVYIDGENVVHRLVEALRKMRPAALARQYGRWQTYEHTMLEELVHGK